jgi:heme/copper-type cytochrome/quinol oxidase subunit 4
MGEALKAPRASRFKLPSFKDLERPTRWDWITAAVLVVGFVLMGANFAVVHHKPANEPFPGGLTALFCFAQLAVSLVGLMLLGKTAKEGTWWGNIAAILTMLVGMSGILLAAALWAAY